MKQLVFFAILAVLISCFPGNEAAAQNANPCLTTSTWWFSDPIPPGWFNYGPYPGTFVFLIAAYQASCAPPPECPCPAGASGGTGGPGGPGGSGPSGGSSLGSLAAAVGGFAGGTPMSLAGEPINLTTGDVYIAQTDTSIPGLGRGLTLLRTWNSLWPANEILYSVGMFGPNWRSTYEERVFMGSDHYMKYSRGNGGFWSFGVNSTGALAVASPASVAAILSQSASNWVLTFQDGSQRQFSLATGLLTAIIDRNGNTTQVQYDGSNRLTAVVDAAGRHLYFGYGTGSTSLLVTSVTSDFGTSLSYSYDAQGRLSQVTQPDLTTITYTYNGQSQITSVTDSNGKVIESHTYDTTGHGLSSSKANGVNALTVTAPQ